MPEEDRVKCVPLLEHCPSSFVGSLEQFGFLLGWVCKSQFSSDCVSTRSELDDVLLLQLELLLGGHLGVVARRFRYLACGPTMVQPQRGEDGRRDAEHRLLPTRRPFAGCGAR